MNYITAPFKWMYAKLVKFNEWVASIAPGIKTKVIATLGFVGSTAGALQSFVTDVPLSQVIGAEYALGATAVLFLLAYWFKSLSK